MQLRFAGLVLSFSVLNIKSYASVGSDALEHEPYVGEGFPDWAAFLIMLFVVLMIFSKLK